MPSPASLADARQRPIGTRVMLSTPAAMTQSIVPHITACAAKCSACCDEPHWRSMVVPGTLSGSFEASTAHAARCWSLCSPAWQHAAHDHVFDQRRVGAGALEQRVDDLARPGRPDASPKAVRRVCRLPCARPRRYRLQP